MIDRRTHLAAILAAAGMLAAPQRLWAQGTEMDEVFPEYGLIGEMLAQPGRRAELAAILAEGTADMPGNMGYIIGESSENPDALWIVEIWQTREHHGASLQLPQVQAAIARGRPLIAGFGQRIEFRPVGGVSASPSL